MTPQHYYNYRVKFGVRAADKRQAVDGRIEQGRREQERVSAKTRGMGCNE